MGTSSQQSSSDRTGALPAELPDQRILTHELLRLASAGLPRAEFLNAAVAWIGEQCGCEAATLRAYEGERLWCVRARRARDARFVVNISGCSRKTGKPTCADCAEQGDPRLLLQASTSLLSDAQTTPRGSCWTGHAEGSAGVLLGGEEASATDEMGSVALIPLYASVELIGVLVLARREPSAISAAEVGLFEAIGEALAAGVVAQQSQAALHERVKELTCLYRLTRLAEDPTRPIEEVLQGIVELLPPAWQYPEIASARIGFDDRLFATERDAQPCASQQTEIRVRGDARGFVEVAYHEARPALDEGPFLREERHLLDAVAMHVEILIERRQALDERQRLHEQLRHADRLATLGQLAAGVAHELNEPLGAILGFAQLSQKAEGLSEQTKTDLQRIVEASLHARDIIKKLMLFARETPPSVEAVNLNEIATEGLVFLESRCLKKGIELRRYLDPHMPQLTADRSQLTQALVNLVVNAIQAMPEGGTLTLTTESRGQSVCLSVEDTGVGMSGDVIKKVFTPFFTTKDVDQGTGLGLSVVEGIVTSHGGTIGVHSEPGRGTRFTVSLPTGGCPGLVESSR